jgi:beta-phosphoglucomutase-like phosphatase (HAD superfamily)
VPIERVAIIEDSPVGVTGAVASGAFVIGLCAGQPLLRRPCRAAAALGAHVIAHSFEEVAALLA